MSSFKIILQPREEKNIKLRKVWPSLLWQLQMCLRWLHHVWLVELQTGWCTLVFDLDCGTRTSELMTDVTFRMKPGVSMIVKFGQYAYLHNTCFRLCHRLFRWNCTDSCALSYSSPICLHFFRQTGKETNKQLPGEAELFAATMAYKSWQSLLCSHDYWLCRDCGSCLSQVSFCHGLDGGCYIAGRLNDRPILIRLLTLYPTPWLHTFYRLKISYLIWLLT